MTQPHAPSGGDRPRRSTTLMVVAAVGIAALLIALGVWFARDRGTTSSTVSGTAATNTTTVGKPCTGTQPPDRWKHVIWLWMEDQPITANSDPAQAPYEVQLATSCALATNYWGVYADVSLPNYMAATSGDIQGNYFANDAGPDVDPNDRGSIFAQLSRASLTWKVYAEAMAHNCERHDNGRYAVRHNPAVYYTNLADDCTRNDMPMGTPTEGNLAQDLKSDTLPSLSFIVPDLCNGTHDCPVSTGDAWLSQVVPTILTSPGYTAGNTLLIITHDDARANGKSPVQTIVVAPSVKAGTTVDTRFDHYSLLRTTQDNFGLAPLGAAADASSMRSAFHC